MPGIEFLDDEGNVLDEPPEALEPAALPLGRPVLDDAAAPWSRLGARGRAAALAPPVLWVAAAVVAVVACFQRSYAERIGSGALYVQAADGWGRYSHRADVSVGSHSTRYGQLFCVAAALLVAAAVLRVLRRPGAAPLALAGAAGLLGCVGAVWLTVHTEFEEIRAAFSRPGMLRPQVLQLTYGPFLALGLTAAAIALLGWAAARTADRALDAAPATRTDDVPGNLRRWAWPRRCHPAADRRSVPGR